jgi:hypothetical protein
MKTIVLYILFIVLININANSQSGCPNFNKYYDYSLYQENLDVAFLSTGGYLTFGGKAYDSLGLSVTSTFINRLDINGDTVWTRSLGGNDETNFYTKTGAFPGVWFRQGEVLQDSIIIACGSYQDSTCFDQFHYYGQVVRYNLNGDTVWTRKLALQDTSVGMYGMLAYDDSTYIITGDYRPFNISNPLYAIRVFVSKYHINGNLIWRKALPQLTVGLGYKMDKAANGDIILSGACLKSNYYDPFIAKLNSSGNIIWADSSGSVYSDFTSKAISLNNGNFVNLVTIGGSFNVNIFKVNARWYSNSGILMFEKTYNKSRQGGFSDGIELIDGGLLLTGIYSDSLTSFIKGFLVRTDSNGDSLWSRKFGDSTTFQFFHSITQTCDGYVMAGVSFQPTTTTVSKAFGWVVHTDTLGFVTTGIEDVQGQLSLANISLPYPNPAIYQTKIKTFVPTIPSNKITSEENSYLFVFNLQGKQIAQIPVPMGEQETNIDVSTYPIGNYFIVLSVNGYNAATQKLMVVR